MRSLARPQETLIADNSCILLFHKPHASLLTVVGKFAPVRALIDGDQLVLRIPFEGARPVAAEIAIWVNGSTYGRFCHRDEGIRRSIRLKCEPTI